jgi:hypothetical protein
MEHMLGTNGAQAEHKGRVQHCGGAICTHSTCMWHVQHGGDAMKPLACLRMLRGDVKRMHHCTRLARPAHACQNNTGVRKQRTAHETR